MVLLRFALVPVLLLLSCSAAQSTMPAERFTAALAQPKVYRAAAGMQPYEAQWVGETNSFWFARSNGTLEEYSLVDASTGARSMIDLARIAASVDHAAQQSKANLEPINPQQFYLPELTFDADGKAFTFELPRGRVRCALPQYDCTVTAPSDADEDKVPGFEGNDPARIVASPDGVWEATVQNFNVFLHRKGDPKPAVPLSLEGNAGDYYQRGSLQWSPDSRHLLAVRVLQGMRRQVTYVESSPESQLQPITSSRFYAKPGDVLDREQPVLFDVAAAHQTIVAADDFPNAYELSHFSWRKDSSAFTFEYNQRGHQRLTVLSVDANTGLVRRVIDETSPTFIEYSELQPSQYKGGKHYRHDLADGREVLWLSERDGWAHLYLYDGQTGKLKNQVTHGNWVVRGVDRVDESRRQIYFEASGVDPKLDPYFLQGYRINFDGTGMIAMTDAPANHALSYSHDGTYYLDRWSRVDLAPELDLRRVADRAVVSTLAKGDLAGLKAAGWTAPEVFVSKGRYGKTDIYGLITRPAHFDPTRKYPVVEYIYAGPHGSFVPKSFTAWTNPLSELGFVVVQIDGMGTNNRSKAFHDVAWKNLKDAGFADRILWHKAAAAKYPWYDISRLGIYGTSAGGQSAMGALLFYPEFYKAAVSNSGCHDNRMDKIWWNEQWMGWPIGPQYAESSNVVNAGRLKGHLLLVMGEMDTNVDPSSTLQVVNALIKNGKDFEFLDVPGGGHGAGGEYGERRLLDFFVRTLTDTLTPNWNAR